MSSGFVRRTLCQLLAETAHPPGRAGRAQPLFLDLGRFRVTESSGNIGRKTSAMESPAADALAAAQAAAAELDADDKYGKQLLPWRARSTRRLSRDAWTYRGGSNRAKTRQGPTALSAFLATASPL